MASYAMTLSALLSTISVSALTAGASDKLASSPTTAGPPKGLALEVSATKTVLPNGHTLSVHEDHSAPLVAVRITYHTESKNKPKGKTGIARLLEQLTFKGSENFNADDLKAVEKLAASEPNGTASADRIRHLQTVPTTALDAALWPESDRMTHLLGAANPFRLDEQSTIVQNDKRPGKNRQHAGASDMVLRATTSVGHPYHRLTIRSMDHLEAATQESVKDRSRSRHGPSDAVLALQGDVTPEVAKPKVDKYLGSPEPGEKGEIPRASQ